MTKDASALATALTLIGEGLVSLAEAIEAGDIQELLNPEAAVDPEPETKKPATRGRSTKAAPPPPPPADDEGDDPITLEDLQELSATLLENGKRKVVNAILKDAGLKSLGDAEEDQFDDLYDALFDEVEALDS